MPVCSIYARWPLLKILHHSAKGIKQLNFQRIPAVLIYHSLHTVAKPSQLKYNITKTRLEAQLTLHNFHLTLHIFSHSTVNRILPLALKVSGGLGAVSRGERVTVKAEAVTRLFVRQTSTSPFISSASNRLWENPTAETRWEKQNNSTTKIQQRYWNMHTWPLCTIVLKATGT